MAKFVSPMRMTSPSFRLSRASSASSTAAPNMPSRSPSASSSDMGGAKTGLADARPRWLDSLDFDQRRVAARHSRHAAQGRDRRQRAMRFEKALLVGGKATMDQRERGVAAEDHASFAPHAVVERRARLSTPTIAATPSAMQRRKMRKPARPPRRSRKAKRRVGARVGCGNESCRRRVHSLLPRGEGGGRSPTDEGTQRRPHDLGGEPSPPTPLPLERGARSARLPLREDGGDFLLPRGEGGGRSPTDEGAVAAVTGSAREPSPPAPLPWERGVVVSKAQPLMPEASPRGPARLRSCPSACGSPGRNARRAWRHA